MSILKTSRKASLFGYFAHFEQILHTVLVILLLNGNMLLFCCIFAYQRVFVCLTSYDPSQIMKKLKKSFLIKIVCSPKNMTDTIKSFDLAVLNVSRERWDGRYLGNEKVGNQDISEITDTAVVSSNIKSILSLLSLSRGCYF